jgi:hypothetical protein
MRRYVFKYDVGKKYERRNSLDFSASHNRGRKAINERSLSYAYELLMGGCFENIFYFCNLFLTKLIDVCCG